MAPNPFIRNAIQWNQKQIGDKLKEIVGQEVR